MGLLQRVKQQVGLRTKVSTSDDSASDCFHESIKSRVMYWQFIALMHYGKIHPEKAHRIDDWLRRCSVFSCDGWRFQRIQRIDGVLKIARDVDSCFGSFL